MGGNRDVEAKKKSSQFSPPQRLFSLRNAAWKSLAYCYGGSNDQAI